MRAARGGVRGGAGACAGAPRRAARSARARARALRKAELADRGRPTAADLSALAGRKHSNAGKGLPMGCAHP
jgi:hypothetical protein